MRVPYVALFTAFLIGACAEGTLEFGGEREDETDTIVVRGDIDDITPQNAVAEIVVFVFTDLEDPGTFSKFAKQRSAILAPDSTEFTIEKIGSGDLTVVFLQDHGANPDGSIDEGDPFAILKDPDEVLDSVRNGQTFTANKIDIDFLERTAEADQIVSGSRPSG